MSFTRSGLASTVRAEAARRRLSQQALGRCIGLSRAAVNSRLMGYTPFTVDEVAALAALFDVPVSVLMDEPGVPARMDAPPNPRRAPAQAVPA